MSSYNLNSLFHLANTPQSYPASTYSGRGIVISGGGKYLPSAYVAIKSIRATGCTLPIQLWHLGRAELPLKLVPLMNSLGVECVDSLLAPALPPGMKLGGWENKPFSIIHSPFEEVLFVDADNMVLTDPTFLFDLPDYRERGAIFWPDFLGNADDFWMIKLSVWDLLKLPRQLGAETESGQMVINKRQTWHPLQVAMHMNEHSDFYYKNCTYGDKDTFTLAWALTNAPQLRVFNRPRQTALSVRIHFAPDGKELFQHGRKWVLPSNRNTPLDNFRLENESLAWVREIETAMYA